jgi:hypothetical protein
MTPPTLITKMINRGREHAERRKAQAAAARKQKLKNKFNKADRKNWKKGL